MIVYVLDIQSENYVKHVLIDWTTFDRKSLKQAVSVAF